MEPQELKGNGHQIINLQLKKQINIRVRSNFDSGNLSKADLGLNSSIIITPANDCAGTEYESHAKGWFHFAISGLPLYTRQKFIIKKMNSMGNQTKFSEYFKPVYRYLGEDWERIEQAIIFNKDDEYELHFEIQVQRNSQIYFAFTYPFSYEELQNLLANVKVSTKILKNIYYSDEILIKSPQGRSLHLLTITSHEHKLSIRQSPLSDWMFPNKTNRPLRFANDKKVVIMSARVHPSEAPASHVMNGILNFLLSKDARAEILRKKFVFQIIPMLNPDGVFLGHHRMDIFNQNLNRFYLEPDPIKQPSSYALRKLGQYFKIDDRLCFYIDLHAHPQRKGNFIYGNWLQNNEEQIITQLFPKILSLNCIQFDYENSCFSKNHMILKDKNEDLSKEGCGRVVFNKNLGQSFAYTLQCGYTCSNYLNELSSVSNAHRKFEKLGILTDDLDNIKSSYYNKKTCYFTMKSYQNLGKSILISILDLFQFNPFSRLPNTVYKDVSGLKNIIREQLNKNKDFKIYSTKLAPNSFVKTKNNHNQRIENNRSTLIGKTNPKKNERFFKNNKSTKKIQSNRRQTLPKMKTYKI